MDQVPDGKEQKGNSSEALLTIDDVILDFTSVWHDGGNDAAEEMAVPPVADHLPEVIPQLSAVFLLPVIFSLVDGNDEALASVFHEFCHFFR